jgi:tRNA dimethylallyltransferase
LALAGPTACGKTATALAIARHQPVEIISVDSALVYQGLDIGAAKPSAAERAEVPHHLIDLRQPFEPYSAADFASDARRLIADIRSRGSEPLLVGGTMLYLKALAEGLATLPAATPDIRQSIDDEARTRGWEALHGDLQRVDPITAARLAPADRQRIQRALEVFRVSGRPISAWQADGPASAQPPVKLHLVSLEPSGRAWLHQRIHDRLQLMLAAGLVDEVRRLRADRRNHPDLPAMRAVGYRQCWQALESEEAGKPLDVGQLLERCTAATRQLAKRQLTWLRSWTSRTIVAADAPQAQQQAVDCAVLHWRHTRMPSPP